MTFFKFIYIITIEKQSYGYLKTKMKKHYIYRFFYSKNIIYIFFTLNFCILMLLHFSYSESSIFDKTIVNYTTFLHEGLLEEPNIVFTNFPNPFNRYTYIYIKFPYVSSCVLSIYDLLGNKVKEFILTENSEYLIKWNATNNNSQKISTGGYICVLMYKNRKLIRKIGYTR